MTISILEQLCGSAKRAEVFFFHLAGAMKGSAITGKLRESAFLAQVMHESGRLKYTREIASGKAYEGRKDLGNIFDGDGPRFKGRGLIMITGRYNYLDCSKALFGDDTLLKSPDLLAAPGPACHSAVWYWSTRQLNELADQGSRGFVTIGRRINGGLNGYDDRKALYELALSLL